MQQRRETHRKPARGGTPGGADGSEDLQRGPQDRGIKVLSICKDPRCQAALAEHPKAHRHSTAECMHHQFCRESTLPVHEDKYQHKTIVGLPNEMAGDPWLPRTAAPTTAPVLHEMQGGELRNVDTSPLRGGLQPSTQLSKTLRDVAEPLKMVPPGRKVVMTDQVIDTWLAAHYGIDADHVPRKQPSTVPRHLFDRFKKLRGMSQTTAHGSRNKRALDSGHADKEGQRRPQAPKKGGKNNAQASNDNSQQYQYRIAPENFKLISYPKVMDVQSITDKTVQQNLEQKMEVQQLQLSKASKLSALAPSIKQQTKKTAANDPMRAPHKLERSRSQAFRQMEAGPKRRAELSLDHSGHDASDLVQRKTEQFQRKFGSDAKYYQRPSKAVRNRQHSGHLQFLNYQEIAMSQEKLNGFKGKIVQKPIDGSLEKPKLPISDSKTNIPRKRNDFFVRSSGMLASRTVHGRAKENLRSMLTARASDQLHDEGANKMHIEENFKDDIVVQIPEASLQYQSDRLGTTARMPISQLNKYSLQHDQKIQAKQLRMQESISRFFVPKKAQKTEMNSQSTSSTNMRVNRSSRKIISEANFKEMQVREEQQQSIANTIQAEERQANAFSPKFAKNLTNTSKFLEKNMTTARSNRKSAEAKGFLTSMVSASHHDMLTLMHTARGGITQRNNNTDVGSTYSATLYHEPSLKSSANFGRSMQKLSQRYNKHILAGHLNSQQAHMQSQDYQTAPTLRSLPQNEPQPVETAFARAFITTAVKMKQNNRQHLAKGKYQSDVKSVSQRVKFEKQETHRMVQKQVLQQSLLHKYGIATSNVKLPAYAMISQSNFTSAPRQGNRHASMSASSMPKAAASKVRKQKELQAEEKEAPVVASGGPQYLNFRDIRNNFGIDQDETSRMPTQQSLFGAKNSADEVDCVEMLAEEENKLEQQILCELQNDQDQETSDKENNQFSDDEDLEHKAQDSINVKIKFILFDLGHNTYHKDFKDYRFWMKIAQKKFQEAGNDELAIDFLRNGLREIPKNPQLLYNYACANEKIGNYHIAVKFFQFASKLKQNWTDALFGEAVTHFKLRNYVAAEACIVKALKSYKKADALEEYEVMLYFKAMVYKKLKQYAKAKRDYESLQKIFCQNEGESILHFVVGLILLPLRESRREKFDYLENTLKLIKHFKKVQPKEKNKLLSNYVNKKTGYLDMEKHKTTLIRILRGEPFFKRFDMQTLEEVLGHGKPEYYNPDEILFLNDRVGIITHGSVRIKTHQHDILSPSVEAKYGKGKILGHYSDNGVTTNPQSWVITYDENTEVLFFETSIFNKLWNIQFQKTDRQIIEANIECNPLLRCLSDQSQYQIIYEDMEIRKFKPGELICRMSKRSKLNSLFSRLQEQQASRLMEDMEVAKAMQHVDGAGGNGGAVAETVISGFVKSLTTHKAHGPRAHVPDLLSAPRSPEPAEAAGGAGQGGVPSSRSSHDATEQPTILKDEDEELLKKCKQHPQYIKLVEDLLRDQAYKEVDGVYIVYQGHVDILSQKDNKLLHQINIFENFGESIIVNTPSYEYFGDLYAGLNPRNPQQARAVKELVADQLLKSRNKLEQEKIKTESAINKKKTAKKSAVTFEEDIMTLNKQERLITKLRSMEEQLLTNTEDLIDPDDCTICLYIPYEKFVSLPASELKRIEEEATLFKLKEAVIKFVAEAYDVSAELLKIY